MREYPKVGPGSPLGQGRQGRRDRSKPRPHPDKGERKLREGNGSGESRTPSEGDAICSRDGFRPTRERPVGRATPQVAKVERPHSAKGCQRSLVA
jgi:hypothetical protein